jgi:predicted DCC family thiol-disulfide oxidoreductase YuxK
MTAKPIIVAYDGTCGLCHGLVRFLLRHDRSANLSFAASDSETGRKLFAATGQDPADPVAMVTLSGDKITTGAEAAIAAVVGLGGIWRGAAVTRWVPAALQEAVYRRVAANRIAWFGRASGCPAPQAQWTERFLP